MKAFLSIVGALLFCMTNAFVAAEGPTCGPGAPAGMKAFAKGIIVSICPGPVIYIDDDPVPPNDAVTTLKAKMNENPKTPVTVFRHGIERSDVIDELTALATSGPKGGGVFVVFPDGQFLGGRNN